MGVIDMEKQISKILQGNIATTKKIYKSHIDIIAKAAEAIVGALENGGKVIAFGNGGSAGDSQHLVAELVGRFKVNRSPLSAVALTTNTSTLTAIANDYGYAETFRRQLMALAKEEDIVIGISTSGQAKNVLNAVREARKLGIKTIALTGKGGGPLAKLADISIIVPSDDTARIQEAHILIIHAICQILDDKLSGPKDE